jgi:hypothetical protein
LIIFFHHEVYRQSPKCCAWNAQIENSSRHSPHQEPSKIKFSRYATMMSLMAALLNHKSKSPNG